MGCLVLVGKDMELDAVGRHWQFDCWMFACW